MIQIKDKKAARRFFISIIPYFIIFSGFQMLGAYLSGINIADLQGGNITSRDFLLTTFFGMLGSVLAVWLFLRFFDKKDFTSIGFSKNNASRDIVLGLLFGFVIMLLGFLVLKFTGQIIVEKMPLNLNEVLLTLGTFVFVAIGEEIYFRGYALGNLMATYGKYPALLISALFFAIVHSLNPDFSVWSFIGIFIAGIFLGMPYIFTKSLWFPIALHFSWNFFQSLFGFNVSGMDSYSLYNLKYTAENLWNGGRFGFESSLLGFLLQLLAIFIVFQIFSKRSKQS